MQSRSTILSSIVGLATRFGHDNRVAIFSYRSWALWYLGYPHAALADAERAVNDAREISQAATLMYVLFHASLPHFYCSNYSAAYALVDELVPLATEKRSLFWKAFGMLMRACNMALTGRASDAVQTITAGLDVFRSTGSTLLMPSWLSYLAKAYADLGQFNDARHCIGEAIAAVETTKGKVV